MQNNNDSNTTKNLITIAICSQNRKNVTAHAGKCRNFWRYTLTSLGHSAWTIEDKTLIELSKEESFSVTKKLPLEINDINTFITSGIGDGFKRFLENNGIQCILISDQITPEEAIKTIIETL